MAYRPHVLTTIGGLSSIRSQKIVGVGAKDVLIVVGGGGSMIGVIFEVEVARLVGYGSVMILMVAVVVVDEEDGRGSVITGGVENT